MAEKIYILVSQSSTNMAKFFKAFTKKAYNHVSLSSDLTTFHSFCRTYRRTPIPATFNDEVTTKGVWGHMPSINGELYELEVCHEQKVHFEQIINHFLKNRRKYAYNIVGLAPLYFNINWERSTKFVCSQFVAHVLNEIGLPLSKPVFLHTPEDFRHIPQLKLVFQGDIKKFCQFKEEFQQAFQPYQQPFQPNLQPDYQDNSSQIPQSSQPSKSPNTSVNSRIPVGVAK